MGKGGNNKKEQMPAAIKTTESIKNFRPFTAELPRRSTVGIYAREVNGHDAPRMFRGDDTRAIKIVRPFRLNVKRARTQAVKLSKLN